VHVWIVLGILALLTFAGSAVVLSLWTSASRPERREVAGLTPVVGKRAKQHGQTESAAEEVG
jgi:hypothetical protein